MTLDPGVRWLLDARPWPDRPEDGSYRVDRTAAALALQGSDPTCRDAPRLWVPGPGGPLPARVYRPESEPADVALPLLVHFHGEGLLPGGLALVDRPCRALAEATGAVVASVRCRTEEPYPRGIRDATAATTWFAEYADELGADPARIGVAGCGDGALVAAAVAQRGGGEHDPVLALQLLLHPVTDFLGAWPSRAEPAVHPGLVGGPDVARFTENYLRGVPDPTEASPLRAHPLAGLPPAVVVTGGSDPVRDEARAYAEALAAAGVRVLDLREDTLVHGFCWLADSVRPAARALRDVGRYVREVFAAVIGAPSTGRANPAPGEPA